MKRFMKCAAFCALVAALSFSGCSRIKSFRVVFEDRHSHRIEARVNASVLGEVAPGTDRKFVFEERVLDSSPTSANQPDVTEVTFTARDLETGKISQPFRRTIYTDRVEQITVQESDFNY